MKLSTLLKTTIATEIEIKDENLRSYYIDYLKEGFDVEDYGVFEIHKAKATLPKELLGKNVKYVDCFNGTLNISVN